MNLAELIGGTTPGADLRLRQAVVIGTPVGEIATIRFADQTAATAVTTAGVRVETGSATADDIAGVRMLASAVAAAGEAVWVLQTGGALLIIGRVGAAAAEGIPPPALAVLGTPGTLIVLAGKSRFPFPVAATIVGVTAMVNSAPTGASVLIDVHKNGTTIFTTQGNRPTIAIGGFASGEAIPDVTAVAAGDYLTVDVDQVGSTVPGADLTVAVRYAA